MAVVFISPRQRQRKFFTVITVVFVLFLFAIYFGVFISTPTENLPTIVFNQAKITVNTSIFNSPQFKDLQPFIAMQSQYSYVATTKDNQIKTGFISAVSVSDAQAMLQGMGLSASEIKEVAIGRDDPFSSYYRQAVVPAVVTKK